MGDVWRAQALAALRPSPSEDAEVRQDAQALRAEVEALLEEQGWEAEARVEGSVAKDTYLRGQADADIFVAFPLDVARDELDARARVLGDLLDDPVVAYAEHPYAQGRWRERPAEIVPCYDIEDLSQMRSAVDRTRFHTDHVRQHLSEDGTDEVRLLKAFLYGAEAYGAEEAVLGFSGYLAELLILAFQDLEGVLAWAVDGFAHPVRLGASMVTSFTDPLVVLDPVDPERNVAAAVSKRTLVRVREAAGAFRASPEAAFFTAWPERAIDAPEARGITRSRRTRVLAIGADAAGAELADPIHAQVRRAVTLATEVLEREQVPIHANAVHLELDEHQRPGMAWGLIEADVAALERPKLHGGPPVSQQAHAEAFRERWTNAEDAAGSVFEEDGRLHVYATRQETTLQAIVEPHLAQARAGKLIDQALEAGELQLLEGDDAIGSPPARAIGALLDRRRPWERR